MCALVTGVQTCALPIFYFDSPPVVSRIHHARCSSYRKKRSSKVKKRTLLTLTSIVAVMAFALSAFVYEQSQLRKNKTADTPASELVRMHSPVFGAASAKVTIVEFFDPSCETCRAFYPGVKDR